MIKHLEWDSIFFKKKIGKINSSTKIVVPFSQLETFELIYLYQKDNEEVQLQGFMQLYQQTCVEYYKILQPNNRFNLANIFSNKRLNLKPDLFYGLSYISGAFSRFKLDVNFNFYDFKNLYRTWIDNSISGLIADDVLCYVKRNKLMGFLTYKIESNSASIGLIAVGSEHQGLGIGRQLIQFLENICLEQSINEIKVVTQKDNINACEFYKRCDFEILEFFTIKHFWKA